MTSSNPSPQRKPTAGTTVPAADSRRSNANADGSQPPKKPVVAAYLADYVNRILRLVADQQSCLLLGALGSGKSDVMRDVAERLNQRDGPGMQAVLIKVDNGSVKMTAVDVFRALVRRLEKTSGASRKLEQATEHDLAEQVRSWMRAQRRDVVLLLDQVELLENAIEVFTHLRAMVMRNNAEPNSRAGKFIIVLASSQAWRERLFNDRSPLINICTEVPMTDCPADIRAAHWEALLLSFNIHPSQTKRYSTQLETLCGGDYYHIRMVSDHLVRTIGRVPKGRNMSGRLHYALKQAAQTPEAVAPLLNHYLELLEDDPEALRVAIRLLERQRVTDSVLKLRQTLAHSSVWTGLFAVDNQVIGNPGQGGWLCFRTAMIETYLRRELTTKPDRVMRAFVRKGDFADAARWVCQFRERGLNVNVLEGLRDILLAWLPTADTVSDAWQDVAELLHIWFGPQAQLLRYVAQRLNKTRLPHPYHQVVEGQLEGLADSSLSQAAHQAYQQRAYQAAPGDVTQRPYFDAATHQVIFAVAPERSEYAAVVLPQSIFDEHISQFEKPSDQIGRLIKFFDVAFSAILQFEQRNFNTLDLSEIQRQVQAHHNLKQTRRVMKVVLTAITAGFGLEFNRCVLLQAIGTRQLRGRAAIGYHSQTEAQAAWRGAAKTFQEAMQQFLTAPRHVLKKSVTPLEKEIVDFEIPDWGANELLSQVLNSRSSYPEVWTRAQLQASPLRDLLYVTESGSVHGATNPVILFPLYGISSDNDQSRDKSRDPSRLLGLVVADKPFTRASITQAQLNSLPSYANQLAQILLDEEQLVELELRTKITELTMERLSLQETLERVIGQLHQNLPSLVPVPWVVVSLWDEFEGSNNDDYPNRRQSTVRLAHSAATQRNVLQEWQHYYYRAGDYERGPIDQALWEAGQMLYISNLPKWQQYHHCADCFSPDDSIRTVYSCALKGDTGQPRGVISFQSDRIDAFNDHDRALFKRFAMRLSNTVDKARVFEGLARSSFHTNQLNVALTELMKPQQKQALYDCILAQTTRIFANPPELATPKEEADSIALILFADANTNGGEGVSLKHLAGEDGALAMSLAQQCHCMRQRAIDHKAVFVEYAGKELVAEELYGAVDCRQHTGLGAQASVWVRIGEDMLCVIAWAKPRRINRTERQAIKLIAEIAARTNGVIEQERRAMKAELAVSLKIEDYELIEHENRHQWNKNIRAIRNSARWAMQDLEKLPADTSLAEAMPILQKRLDRINEISTGALDRMVYSSIREMERISLKPWLTEFALHWSTLNQIYNAHCELDLSELSGDEGLLETRPTILRWILTELLDNARTAEQVFTDKPRIVLSARHRCEEQRFVISVTNSAPISGELLALVRSGLPVDKLSTSGSGRGIWIAGAQVRALLMGHLQLPDENSGKTIFSIDLPERLPDD